MLNRVITRNLDNARADALIIPNTTATAPPEPTTTPEPEVTDEPEATETPASTVATVANIRLVHVANNVEAVDVFINESLSYESVAFGTITGYTTRRTGTFTITVVPEDARLTQSLLSPVELTLEAGGFVTLTLTGSDDEGTLALNILAENYDDLPDDTGRVLLIHAVEGAPAADVLLNGRVVTSALAFGQSATLDIASGTYDAQVLETNTDDEVLLDIGDFEIADDSYQIVIIAPDGDSPPQVVANTLTETDITDLRTREAFDDEEQIIEADVNDDQDVVDVLIESDDFGILIDALDAADEAVFNRLRGQLGDPITLFAPTDQAFADLLATLGISANELFENESLLTDILLYHLVEGAISAGDLRGAAGTSIITNLPENQGFFVTINDDGAIELNNVVRFVQTDIEANNGVIHVIDEVLLPAVALEAFGL